MVWVSPFAKGIVITAFFMWLILIVFNVLDFLKDLAESYNFPLSVILMVIFLVGCKVSTDGFKARNGRELKRDSSLKETQRFFRFRYIKRKIIPIMYKRSVCTKSNSSNALAKTGKSLQRFYFFLKIIETLKNN